jgi:hypothetical protein
LEEAAEAEVAVVMVRERGKVLGGWVVLLLLDPVVIVSAPAAVTE